LFFCSLCRYRDVFISTTLFFANATASLGEYEISIVRLALSGLICCCPFVLIGVGYRDVRQGVGINRSVNVDVGQPVDICDSVAIEIVAVPECDSLGEL
jgi:hypothetical protein